MFENQFELFDVKVRRSKTEINFLLSWKLPRISKSKKLLSSTGVKWCESWFQRFRPRAKKRKLNR